MITAHEAVQLVKTSDVEVEKWLKIIDVKIREAASAGKRELALYETGLWTSEPHWVSVKPTPIQVRLCQKLTSLALGFSAKVEAHGEQYVPRAFEDRETPEQYVNHVIVIRW